MADAVLTASNHVEHGRTAAARVWERPIILVSDWVARSVSRPPIDRGTVRCVQGPRRVRLSRTRTSRTCGASLREIESGGMESVIGRVRTGEGMANESGQILVVDDNAVNLTLLTRALVKAGYATLQAETGEAGERLAQEHHPDLILLDVELPGKNGFEVCQALKSEPATASIPIIFLTARSDSGDVETAFSLGGCDYVTKPFRISEVKARVSVHLELRRAQTDLIEQNKRLEDLSSLVAETNLELAKIARLDSLTNVLNRGAWEEAIAAENDRFSRSRAAYTVLMLDVDHFKLLNDSLGHQRGDECLRKVSQCLRDTCRTLEVVGRYGGEEFVVLAPDTTEAQGVVLAERLCQAIRDLQLAHPSSPTANYVTTSIGVAESCHDGWEESLRRADVALYQAKGAGRDRVCAHHGPTPKSVTDKFDADEGEVLPHSTDGMGHTVLVVDDDDDARSRCRRALEAQSYVILEAKCTETGVTVAESARPDAILLDVTVPGLDGISAARQLRSKSSTSDIPIIVVSARADAECIAECLAAGADEYVPKPFRLPELVHRLKFVLRARTAQHALVVSNATRGEQARVLGLLLELSRSIGSCEVLDEALRQTVTVAAELTSCSRVSIMLPDGEGSLAVAGCAGLDDDATTPEKIPIDGSLAGQVFRSGTARVVNRSDQAGDLPDSTEQPYILSVPSACTPITIGDAILGVFSFSERVNRQPFGPGDLEYIDLITRIAGTAIQAIQSREARDDARDSILAAFALLGERRDSDTGRHVERVTEYTLVLADELRRQGYFEAELTDEFLAALRRATPIHDIGKVAIPDHILLKPGPLTPEERDVIETHTTIARDTIRSVRNRVPGVRMLEVAEDIAFAHHEWYDGHGYPTGASGDDIPLSARIVAIADVYDAVTTKRPYKEAMSHEAAESIIRAGAGEQFDPVIVSAFLRRVEDIKKLSTALADESKPAVAGPAPLARV